MQFKQNIWYLYLGYVRGHASVSQIHFRCILPSTGFIGLGLGLRGGDRRIKNYYI